MPHIKLTESFYIDTEFIDMVVLTDRSDMPWVEVWTKRHDLCEMNFSGAEANEVWNNWKAYMERVESTGQES